MAFFDNLRYELQKQNKLTILIVVNLVLFLFINISVNIININVLDYLALPLNFKAFISHFWTLVTYMFAHDNFGHIFYNMLLLYFNGRMFSNLLTEKRLVFVYILSGISGGLLLLLLGFIFPHNFATSHIYGASAAIIGIICALAMYTPNMPVNIWGIIEIKYKYLALIIFTILTILDFAINTGGKISHFGGAFFGLFFGYMLKNGNDFSKWSYYKPAQKPRLKVVHSNQAKTQANVSTDSQQTIDALLDKISKNGYENLSKHEKELLFKLSQKK